MKKLYLLLILLVSSINLLANGVLVVNASDGVCLKLNESDVSVYCENQVAIITARQKFINNFDRTVKVKFAFPLSVNASATHLSYNLGGIWYEANIAPTQQDTTLPGGSGGTTAQNITDYLGESPIYFNIEHDIEADSSITVELTYVEFLTYEFGNVFFEYPNNYGVIQTEELSIQEFSFELVSSRSINSIHLLSHNYINIENNGYNAKVEALIEKQSADENYQVMYSLSLDELGLFSFSTYLDSSDVPDSEERGFFAFVAEPEPSEGVDIIKKVFTLIIDRSGSMGGDKMIQARNAASFIIENLNEGDKFNIVDFSSGVNSFRNGHIEINESNKESALAYISGLNAQGGTNISGSFERAVPQFSSSDSTAANIIIFFTDGKASNGITQNDLLVNHVNELVASTETDITIFTFGIGSNPNEQLLTLLANQNNGLAEFLGNDELEDVITNFYLKIRNPVLLNTQLSVPSNITAEIYPQPLPNLYKGQQMIVTGRYTQPGDVQIKLTGHAFGKKIEYDYKINLADSSVLKYQFLAKVWAKKKIENLLIQYYSMNQNFIEAEVIKNQIIDLSLKFGIITEFTSFTGGVTDVEEEEETITVIGPADFKIVGNYPNPFNPSTKIRVMIGTNLHQDIQIKIFNSIGQLIRVLTLNINGAGIYEIAWDGLTNSGTLAPSDVYVYVVEINNILLSSKMILLK